MLAPRLLGEKDFFVMNTKTIQNDLITLVNNHNDVCAKTMAMWSEENQCVETMRQGNVTTGIEFCCQMREVGLDAIVDMVSGEVLPREEVEEDDRYKTFEYQHTAWILKKMEEMVEWAETITTEEEYEEFVAEEEELYALIDSHVHPTMSDYYYEMWCDRINDFEWNIPTDK